MLIVRDRCGNDVFCLVKRFEFLFFSYLTRMAVFEIIFIYNHVSVMVQFKYVSKVRANGWFSEGMFVPAVVIELVSFISVSSSNNKCST